MRYFIITTIIAMAAAKAKAQADNPGNHPELIKKQEFNVQSVRQKGVAN